MRPQRWKCCSNNKLAKYCLQDTILFKYRSFTKRRKVAIAIRTQAVVAMESQIRNLDGKRWCYGKDMTNVMQKFIYTMFNESYSLNIFNIKKHAH